MHDDCLHIAWVWAILLKIEKSQLQLLLGTQVMELIIDGELDSK